MALSLTDVEKIAKLSRLSLTEEEKGKTLSEIAKESGFTVTHTYTKEFIKSDKKDKKDDNQRTN